MALVAGVLVAGPVAAACSRAGWVDPPGGHKAHARAVPFGGFLYVLLLVHPLAGAGPRVLGSASAILALGLAEDALKARGREIPWPYRLLGFALAVGLLAGDPALFRGLGDAAGWAALLLLFLATIHFNWLDHADGLASGAGLGALLGLLAATGPAAAVLAAPAGLLAAFFCVNGLRPGGARLYLGDAGAQLLGFLVVLLALAQPWEQAGAQPAVTCLLAASAASAVPLLDALRVVILRLRGGQPPWQPDRERHLGHVAARRGISRPRAALGVLAVAFALTWAAARASCA